MVGIGLESTLTLSGMPSGVRGVCGVHRPIEDSLRDICTPTLSLPASRPCISCRLIPLLRLVTASYLSTGALADPDCEESSRARHHLALRTNDCARNPRPRPNRPTPRHYAHATTPHHPPPSSNHSSTQFAHTIHNHPKNLNAARPSHPPVLAELNPGDLFALDFATIHPTTLLTLAAGID
ncbi:unnamed protein product, partial [Iphiclides podalirius]